MAIQSQLTPEQQLGLAVIRNNDGLMASIGSLFEAATGISATGNSSINGLGSMFGTTTMIMIFLMDP